MKLLTQDPSIGAIFGTIVPPPGSLGGDPIAAISKIGSVALQIIVIIAAFMSLIYMLWGALDWITSGGEKEKLTKAQNKIVNAVIGLIVLIVVFSLFTLVTGQILGNKIIDTSGGGWRLIIPTIAP